jgi:hypothetical protein
MRFATAAKKRVDGRQNSMVIFFGGFCCFFLTTNNPYALRSLLNVKKQTNHEEGFTGPFLDSRLPYLSPRRQTQACCPGSNGLCMFNRGDCTCFWVAVESTETREMMHCPLHQPPPPLHTPRHTASRNTDSFNLKTVCNLNVRDQYSRA